MKTIPAHTAAAIPKQRGAVLFVSLIMLLVLSLFALVSANTSIMENKMVGNARNAQLANMAADSALDAGKAKVMQTAAAFGAAEVCARIACAQRVAGTAAAVDAFLATPAAIAAATPFEVDLSQLHGADETAHLASNPIYVIEDLGVLSEAPDAPAVAPNSHLFRISARGVGGSASYSRAIETTIAILQ